VFYPWVLKNEKWNREENLSHHGCGEVLGSGAAGHPEYFQSGLLALYFTRMAPECHDAAPGRYSMMTKRPPIGDAK
jgi:hypothetical protein